MMSGRQILILEDEALLLKSIVAFLQSIGDEPYPASSISEAERIIQSVDLDFALIDINLPDGNGLSLLQEKRFSRNTRVIVMTADGGIQVAIDAMKRGAADYLSKPFDVEELPVIFSRLERERASDRKKQYERESAVCCLWSNR